MAKRQKQKQQDDTLVDIVEVRDQATGFVERNQNIIFGVLVGLVVIVGGIFVYRTFIQMPKQKAAAAAMFQAQQAFERDSFALALNGNATFMGLADIVQEYSGTEAGNLASYYAGVAYLNLGQFDAAIDYLEDYDAEGELLPITTAGALGDAYSEKGDFAKALGLYEEAVAEAAEHDALAAYYLKKLGMLHEHQGRPQDALRAYQRIRDDYPTTPIGNDIEKFIARVTPKG